jgi:hypothetical protein
MTNEFDKAVNRELSKIDERLERSERNRIKRLGFCRFCGQKLKIVRSVHLNNITISRVRVCDNSTCSKDIQTTREIEADRYVFLRECERLHSIKICQAHGIPNDGSYPFVKVPE